ncbi:hypothetical protein OROHE_010349 [Orobanche hederae]
MFLANHMFLALLTIHNFLINLVIESEMDIGQSSSTNKKRKNLYSFFSKVDKPKDGSVEQAPISSPIEPPLVILPSVTSSSLNNNIPSLDLNLESYASIERDPGKRKRMCEHPVNERDRIRRAYLRLGPYHPKLLEYPRTQCGKQNRRFQEHWYEKFRWLEYSPTTDKAYCFHCFLFGGVQNRRSQGEFFGNKKCK